MLTWIVLVLWMCVMEGLEFVNEVGVEVEE